MADWYPTNRLELNFALEDYLDNKQKKVKELHGFIVPHAGYYFSGPVAGKAYSLLQGKKIEKVIIFGPSHYSGFKGIKSLFEIVTPFGKVNIVENDYEKVKYEHSVQNQVPFIQKLFPKAKILPLVVGQITLKEAEEYAKTFAKEKAVFVFSTDLSHFLSYSTAKKADKKTINIIEGLKFNSLKDLDACGIYPLLIAMNLCKLKGWKPKLLEYKNSGDIIEDKQSVVGYASFYF